MFEAVKQVIKNRPELENAHLQLLSDLQVRLQRGIRQRDYEGLLLVWAHYERLKTHGATEAIRAFSTMRMPTVERIIEPIKEEYWNKFFSKF